MVYKSISKIHGRSLVSDFVGFINDFKDWFTDSCNFELEQNAQNPTTGEITKTWATVQSNVSFAIYTTNSVQTNVNDKFVNQKILECVFDIEDLSITPTISHRILYNSEYYYIEGTDDIQEQGEVLILTLRKEYAG